MHLPLRPIVAIPLIVGVVFSLIAAIMAFAITLEEYTHHYPDGKEPIRHAVKSAIIAFVLFFILTVLTTKLMIR